MRIRRAIIALAAAGLAGAAAAQPAYVGRWECGVIMYPTGASDAERTDFILHMEVRDGGRCALDGQVKLNGQYNEVSMPTGSWSVDGATFTCAGALTGPYGVHDMQLVATWRSHGEMHSDLSYDWGRSITTCRGA